MDCRTALEILDVARPDSGDLSDPEFAEAAAHIEAHDDCRQEFLRRQQLDRDIGIAVRDVAVPQDLQARLLADFAEADETAESASIAASSAETKAPQHRRVWMKVVAGMAVCLVAGVIAWQFLPGDTERIDVNQLPGRVADLLSNGDFRFADLPEFSESFEAEIPLIWQTAPNRVSFSEPREYRLPDQPDLAIAMYQVAFRLRGTPVTGYLLVLPAESVNELPPAASLESDESKYHGPIAVSRSWKSTVPSGQLVYVCVVPGGVDQLDELMKRLRSRVG